MLSKIRLFFFIESGEGGRGTSEVETSVKLTELNERKKAALELLAKYGGESEECVLPLDRCGLMLPLRAICKAVNSHE